MNSDLVQYSTQGSVARITLNAPEVLNMIGPKMQDQLNESLHRATNDEGVRVIIISGSGRAFCAGHDPAHFPFDPPASGHRFAVRVLDRQRTTDLEWFMKLRDLPKPTIAQVHGHCIMAGWMLAMACDLIIASEDALFLEMGPRYAANGIPFNTYVQDLGARKAKEVLFRGKRLPAAELYRLGMVNEVVPREELADRTMVIAQEIAEADPFLLRLAKQTVNDVQDASGFRTTLQSAMYLHTLCELQGQAPGVEYADARSASQRKRP